MSRETNKNATPTRLDQALATAEVLADEYDDFDEHALMDRIARRVVWERASALEHRARQFRNASGQPAREPALVTPQAPAPTAVHARAASKLEVLSSRVVRDRHAIAAMALLVDDGAIIEPQGALAFACLLYLTDRHEAAQFWWQFTAGAGSTTAAHCLYLHHLQRGERHVANRWYAQAIALHRAGGDDDWMFDHPPALVDEDDAEHHLPPLPPPSTSLMWEVLHAPSAGELRPTAVIRSGPGPADEASPVARVRRWLCNSPVADAVRNLEVRDDDDFGVILPMPDPELAAELEGCAASAC
ncbi:hypothetical protein ABZ553_40885 [Streptomyces sparsogenes]|uniref:hypothetical protein n=1 Tax=Streptomyces sparsogenes TaxID=67365 RepID=UPI0033C7C0EE